MTEEINNEKTNEAKDSKGKESERLPPASPLEEARLLAERIEKGNAELKALLEKQEKLAAEARLEGKGFAGQNSPEAPEQKKKQDAIEFFKGSGIDKAIEKYG